MISTTYLYTYTCHEEEQSLCNLEKRSMFNVTTDSSIIESTLKIDPSRSPFIKERIDVMYKLSTLDDLIEKIKKLPSMNKTFKVVVINHGDNQLHDKVGFLERRQIERSIGMVIPGKADLQNPEVLFAVMRKENQWYFGEYIESESIWYHHQQKPHQYSTALSTRVARAVVNIAAPQPEGLRVIDPCCGIGTVLVEALSMGISIVGSDINPLVMKGVRENIAHFGYHTEVRIKDIRDVKGTFDVAIIDMPYNLCSVMTDDEQLEMLTSARTFTKKLVIATIEPIDTPLKKAGFNITDRCTVTKGTFTREILVCI